MLATRDHARVIEMLRIYALVRGARAVGRWRIRPPAGKLRRLIEALAWCDARDAANLCGDRFSRQKGGALARRQGPELGGRSVLKRIASKVL